MFLPNNISISGVVSGKKSFELSANEKV
jgi:hypothetical protein